MKCEAKVIDENPFSSTIFARRMLQLRSRLLLKTIGRDWSKMSRYSGAAAIVSVPLSAAVQSPRYGSQTPCTRKLEAYILHVDHQGLGNLEELSCGLSDPPMMSGGVWALTAPQVP